MTASILPRLTIMCAVSIGLLVASAALAQTGPDSGPEAPTVPKGTAAPAPKGTTAPKPKAAPASAPKAGEKKAVTDGEKAKPSATVKAGWGTEAEAKSHCRGGVVWVDQNHFNQYPGSREYGRKPGNFSCE